MVLKLYLDFLSQPSRALYIFLKLNEIPFELCPVALRKGEHFREEFKNLNRFQKVPFIHDDNFKLSESIAIVRYLARKHNVDNNWYPKEAQKQAQVDEYLEWQHTNTRIFCAMYFQKTWLIPLITGQKADPEKLEFFKNNMITCLDNIENIWLAKTPYLSGDKVSVADVFGVCEIDQLELTGYDPTEGRPRLSAWLERVRNETKPFYNEAHSVLERLVRKTKEEGTKAKL